MIYFKYEKIYRNYGLFLFLFLRFIWFFLFFKFIFKLYIIVLVLQNIKMNPPQVYMCSPSWTLLPPPSPYHPSGSFQCTSPKHPVSCIKPGLAIHFMYDIIRTSMPFSDIHYSRIFYDPPPRILEIKAKINKQDLCYAMLSHFSRVQLCATP